MNESITKEVFPIKDLNSSFFDSLRSDYDGFDEWFKKKVENKEEAYIQRDENGEVQTAHTLNNVFCAVIGKTCEMKKFGSLQDVAPTFLDLMGLKNSKYFEGKSLIVNNVDNV